MTIKIRLRHTDRRPLTGPPVGPADIATIVTPVEAEGASLHIPRPDQVADLGTADRDGVGGRRTPRLPTNEIIEW